MAVHAEQRHLVIPQKCIAVYSRRMSLNRPQNDRIVAGVASGLAHRFDIPVWVVRLLFVVLIPLPPSALLIYLVLWIVIPNGPGYTILS